MTDIHRGLRGGHPWLPLVAAGVAATGPIVHGTNEITQPRHHEDGGSRVERTEQPHEPPPVEPLPVNGTREISVRRTTTAAAYPERWEIIDGDGRIVINQDTTYVSV